MDTGLRRLRYFQTLSRELNFRRAARMLNITQPALSRAIAQLEGEIGTLLFERTNRQVALTLAGQTFAKGCDRVLRALDETVDQTQRVARGYTGTLVVGYTDTVIAGRLPDIVETFRNVAPDVNIRLVQAYTDRQIQMLDGGLLDVGLLTGPLSQPGLETLTVQRDRLMAVLPVGHPLAARKRITLRDLISEPFVLGDLDRWGAYNTQLFAHCERAGFQPRIVQTAPEARAIVGLVSCGLGVTILPESFATMPEDRVAALPLADIDAPMLTQAAWPAAQVQPALAHFVDHLSRWSCDGEASASRNPAVIG